jgi:hypothetical protein
MKTGILVTFTIFISLFLGARTASACMCAAPQPVDSELERSAVAGVFKVLSVEDRPERTGDGNLDFKVVTQVKFTIENVYKGTLRAGDTVTLEQVRMTGCDRYFFTEQTGTSFLFYLDTDPSADPKWRVSGCSRSGDVKEAAADLMWLNNIEKMRGKTRLSGRVTRYYSVNGAGRREAMADWGVRISGNGTVIQLKTDANGVYEVYDLKPGRYKVTAEEMPGYSMHLGQVDVLPGRQAEMMFHYVSD